MRLGDACERAISYNRRGCYRACICASGEQTIDFSDFSFTFCTDFETAGGEQVIAMEYVSGGELFDMVLENEGLTETQAKPLFYQIATAVAHCHKVSTWRTVARVISLYCIAELVNTVESKQIKEIMNYSYLLWYIIHQLYSCVPFYRMASLTET